MPWFLPLLFAASASAWAQPADAWAKDRAARGELASSRSMTVHVLRLRPGEDLQRQLALFARAVRLEAGVVLAATGSLRRAALRLADQPEASVFEGKREIVSLSGTLSSRDMHLHLAVSDGAGATVGGHLVDGCVVYTTVELAVAELPGLRFLRRPDAASGYEELSIGRAPDR